MDRTRTSTNGGNAMAIKDSRTLLIPTSPTPRDRPVKASFGGVLSPPAPPAVIAKTTKAKEVVSMEESYEVSGLRLVRLLHKTANEEGVEGGSMVLETASPKVKTQSWNATAGS
ncbi:hypothetical protein HDU96_007344 [Phlyctochytrium bullatum]|nr:hypothetical protein HDU96_007344 [Phlyctochytrium bullatum]